LLAITFSAVHAQELAMDLHVRAGAVPGSITVELFPGNSQSAGFRLSLRSEEGERTVPTQTLLTTIPDLVSGRTYLVSAVGLSPDGAITVTSPVESILAP